MEKSRRIILCSFLNKGRKARATFTLKGNMSYAITDCSMEQLPEALRKKIAGEYQGYTLLQATEITAYDTVAFQAVLESAAGYITLKSTAEGIEVVEEQKKAK